MCTFFASHLMWSRWHSYRDFLVSLWLAYYYTKPSTASLGQRHHWMIVKKSSFAHAISPLFSIRFVFLSAQSFSLLKSMTHPFIFAHKVEISIFIEKTPTYCLQIRVPTVFNSLVGTNECAFRRTKKTLAMICWKFCSFFLEQTFQQWN